MKIIVRQRYGTTLSAVRTFLREQRQPGVSPALKVHCLPRIRGSFEAISITRKWSFYERAFPKQQLC